MVVTNGAPINHVYSATTHKKKKKHVYSRQTSD